MRRIPGIGWWGSEMKTDTISQIYTVIGREIEHKSLGQVLENLTPVEKEQIFGACSRIHLINSIQSTKKHLDTWALINTDSLQVYLLCTCLDALADKNTGVGKRFRQLLCGLPQMLKNELINSYAVIKEPSENLSNWEKYSNEVKLNRVFEYIYQLRRNTFTHQAAILPTALYTTGVSGYTCFIPPGVWDYSVYFCYRSKLHSEISLLRLIIIGKIRLMLQLNVDTEFIDQYWQDLREEYHATEL